jgi:hypothetical protein
MGWHTRKLQKLEDMSMSMSKRMAGKDLTFCGLLIAYGALKVVVELSGVLPDEFLTSESESRLLHHWRSV